MYSDMEFLIGQYPSDGHGSQRNGNNVLSMRKIVVFFANILWGYILQIVYHSRSLAVFLAVCLYTEDCLSVPGLIYD